MNQVICAACNGVMTLSPAAPAQIMCPNCRTRLINPFFGKTPPPLPLPVIPLEQQASADQSRSTTLLVVMAVMLLGGAGITASILGVSNALLHLAVFVLIGGLIFGSIVLQSRQSRRPKPEISHWPEIDQHGGSPILSYRTPDRQPTNAWAFVGGFFAALGICAAGFFTLGLTVGYEPKAAHGFILLAVITLVLGFILITPMLSRRPGWTGFGRGVAVGMGLGLLALGPCAFCYTMTLA